MVEPFTENCARFLGAEIYIRRKLSGLTLDTVAADLGTTRKTLTAVEKGSRKPDFLLYMKAYLTLGGSLDALTDYLIASMYGSEGNALLLKQNSDRDEQRARELNASKSVCMMRPD